MTNKILALQKNRAGLILVFLVCGLMIAIIYFVTQITVREPRLVSYRVSVSPAIQDDDLKTVRLALEEAVFKTTNNALAQDTKLTYSEALDNVLPISKVISNLPSGIVLVINNYGIVTAHDVRVGVILEAPIKKYKVFSSGTFSVTDEDKSKGILKINVDQLASGDKIQIAILPSGDYPVLLTASRIGDLPTPSLLTTPDNGFGRVEIAGTQTAIAIYNQDNIEGLLQFHVEKTVDNIQTFVLISSNETQSYSHGNQESTTVERDLFFETFQQ